MAFAGLLKLAAAWVAAMVLAIVACTQVASWPLRIVFLSAALLSVPAYVLVHLLREYRKQQRRAIDAERVAREVDEAWQAVCAQPQALSVMVKVAGAEPVDLRVREAEGMIAPLWVHLVSPPRKTVCWMDPPGQRCVQHSIANVQTEFIKRGGAKNGDDAMHRMWNFSIAGQARTEIGQMTARYVLEVAQAERHATLIDRFRVAVLDSQTDTVLAETWVYRRGWVYGNVPRTAAGEVVSSYHPDRDLAIGRMLEHVFPVGGDEGR